MVCLCIPFKSWPPYRNVKKLKMQLNGSHMGSLCTACNSARHYFISYYSPKRKSWLLAIDFILETKWYPLLECRRTVYSAPVPAGHTASKCRGITLIQTIIIYTLPYIILPILVWFQFCNDNCISMLDVIREYPKFGSI